MARFGSGTLPAKLLNELPPKLEGLRAAEVAARLEPLIPELCAVLRWCHKDQRSTSNAQLPTSKDGGDAALNVERWTLDVSLAKTNAPVAAPTNRTVKTYHYRPTELCALLRWCHKDQRSTSNAQLPTSKDGGDAALNVER